MHVLMYLGWTTWYLQTLTRFESGQWQRYQTACFSSLFWSSSEGKSHVRIQLNEQEWSKASQQGGGSVLHLDQIQHWYFAMSVLLQCSYHHIWNETIIYWEIVYRWNIQVSTVKNAYQLSPSVDFRFKLIPFQHDFSHKVFFNDISSTICSRQIWEEVF